MTNKELITKLREYPEDWEVQTYQHGGVFDSPIKEIVQMQYDKARSINLITILS